MALKTEPFIIERTLNASIEKVWEAITSKDHMEKWSFYLKEFKPEVGFEFRFDGKHDDMVYHHICKITEVVIGKKLAYTWRYDGYEGNSLVTWELFGEGNKTRVKLTHTGLETFPKIADFAKSNFEMGWTEIIDKILKEEVEK